MMRLNRYFCSLLAACAALSCAWAQTPEETTRTWVVDNNLDNPAADFHVLQEAIDAAAVGDRILVVPSLQPYGYITINQGVTLIGAGFGYKDFVSGGPMKSLIRGVTFPMATSNVTLTGLTFSGQVYFRDGNANGLPIEQRTTRNILIYRNEFLGIDNFNSSIKSESDGWFRTANITLINNYIDGFIEWNSQGEFLHFFNNHIGDGLTISDNTTATIENNYISGSRKDVRVGKGVFRNNIITGTNVYRPAEGAILENNIYVNTQNIAPTNNQIKVDDLSTIMVLEGEFAERWALVEGSPAIGHGVGGVDAGIMGGRYPWGKAELSMLPYIKDLRAPSVVFKGDQATVEVEIGNPN